MGLAPLCFVSGASAHMTHSGVPHLGTRTAVNLEAPFPKQFVRLSAWYLVWDDYRMGRLATETLTLDFSDMGWSCHDMGWTS